jgi:hypothetical protein
MAIRREGRQHRSIAAPLRACVYDETVAEAWLRLFMEKNYAL